METAARRPMVQRRALALTGLPASRDAPPAALPAPDAGPVAAPPEDCTAMAPDAMLARATAAANFLKALAHDGRLMILCHLSTGERSVRELETLLDSRQAAVSQQLARLRLEGLVTCRREGKAIFYALGDPKVRRTIELIYELFCEPAAHGHAGGHAQGHGGRDRSGR